MGILEWMELGSVEDFRWCSRDSGLILGVEWVEVIAGILGEVWGWIWRDFAGAGRSGSMERKRRKNSDFLAEEEEGLL